MTSSNITITRGNGSFRFSSTIKLLKWSEILGLLLPGLCAGSLLDLASSNSLTSRFNSYSCARFNIRNVLSSYAGCDFVFEGGMGTHVQDLSFAQLLVDISQ